MHKRVHMKRGVHAFTIGNHFSSGNQKEKSLQLNFLSVAAVRKKGILSENKSSYSVLLGRRNSNKLYHIYKHLYKVLPYV